MKFISKCHCKSNRMLLPDDIFNMVVKVPKWSNAKMEISLKETLNPIKQEESNGKLRFIPNQFPHKGYLW